MVDKISTGYDITQQQRTRPYRRARKSAGSLAPTPEVARTRHAFPQLPFVSTHQGWFVFNAAKHSVQRAVSAVCCRVGCTLVPSDCCSVVLEGQCCYAHSLLMEVHFKSFTQIRIFTPFWAKLFHQSYLGNLFHRNFSLNYLNANTRTLKHN